MQRTDFRCVPCLPQTPITPNMDLSRESDGGGGSSGMTPLVAGSSPDESPLSGPRDIRTPHPPESEAAVSRVVLSLEQIRVTGCSNEYTGGPTAPCPRTEQDNTQERINNQRNLQSEQDGGHSPSEPPQRTSGDSPAPGHRLTGPSRTEIIRVQPKRPEQSPEELKPLTEPPPGGQGGPHKHWDRCEECRRCRCPECVRPRVLPSCWLCGRRCMCSAQSAVEYGTCVCCVKGLFYHCSSDDEDTCADKPFSCSQPHCCARWTTVSLLAVLFPCLLCYLPARTCVHACQSCYDRAARPGCRCGPSANHTWDLQM